MFTDDDLDPKTKRPKPRPLDALSIPELQDYIAALKDEIARAEENMRKKEKQKAAAATFFKG